VQTQVDRRGPEQYLLACKYGERGLGSGAAGQRLPTQVPRGVEAPTPQLRLDGTRYALRQQPPRALEQLGTARAPGGIVTQVIDENQ
jgi:hypothetical protein